MVKDWEGTWTEIQDTLRRAQERQRKWHDQKRLPAPEYTTLEDVTQDRAKKADRVMLNRKNIRTRRPMEKLDHQMFEPFVVLRKVGHAAYELQLPEHWGIHPVFNVGLLEPLVFVTGRGGAGFLFSAPPSTRPRANFMSPLPG